MKIESSQTQTDYKNRMNRVFDYIDANLDSRLSLEAVSKIAHFSPYHFHRVFKFVANESVNQYVTRRRIEKSALDLMHTTSTITEIFSKYGFNNNSSFSRSFKKFYGISPKEFRKKNQNRFSKIGQQESKNGQLSEEYSKYICVIENLKKWIQMNAKIQVREISELSLATITHIGINGMENTFDKLTRWANSKHLLQDSESKIGRLFHDSLKVTAPDKVRMSVFLATTMSFEAEGEINKLNIPAGKCIVSRFEISPIEFEKSWTSLFIWMNENGYHKSDKHPFEIYHNDHREHPENKFIVDLYIPIK